jgi:hypothetical protein
MGVKTRERGVLYRVQKRKENPASEKERRKKKE